MQFKPADESTRPVRQVASSTSRSTPASEFSEAAMIVRWRVRSPLPLIRSTLGRSTAPGSSPRSSRVTSRSRGRFCRFFRRETRTLRGFLRGNNRPYLSSQTRLSSSTSSSSSSSRLRPASIAWRCGEPRRDSEGACGIRDAFGRAAAAQAGFFEQAHRHRIGFGFGRRRRLGLGTVIDLVAMLRDRKHVARHQPMRFAANAH